MKILIVTLALVAVALSETITSFEKIPNSARSFVPTEGEQVSYPVGYVPPRKGQKAGAPVIPPDLGGNWGDNIWGTPEPSKTDSLVIREIKINKIDRFNMQVFNWQVDVPQKKISHMRFLNIGRERAYVYTVTAATNGGPTASATIYVQPGTQMRLLVEVYVK